MNAEAIANTGRVMGEVNADILAVIEAENRPALLRFSELLPLPQVNVKPYDHIMLVDGNDDRGIDVGLLTRDAWPIRTVVSHVDDRNDLGNRLFRPRLSGTGDREPGRRITLAACEPSEKQGLRQRCPE